MKLTSSVKSIVSQPTTSEGILLNLARSGCFGFLGFICNVPKFHSALISSYQSLFLCVELLVVVLHFALVVSFSMYRARHLVLDPVCQCLDGHFQFWRTPAHFPLVTRPLGCENRWRSTTANDASCCLSASTRNGSQVQVLFFHSLD